MSKDDKSAARIILELRANVDIQARLGPYVRALLWHAATYVMFQDSREFGDFLERRKNTAARLIWLRL